MQFSVRHPENDEEVVEAVKCWKKEGTGGTFCITICKECYQEIFIAVDPKNQLLGAVNFLRDQMLWIS